MSAAPPAMAPAAPVPVSVPVPAQDGAAVHPSFIVCDECDALYTRRLLAFGTVARCVRCGALLGRGHRVGIQGQLALTVAALIVFVIGNSADIVILELRGVHVRVTLHEAIGHTWGNGEHLVAVLAAATAFAFPLTVIGLRLWLLGPLAAGRRPPFFVAAMHLLRWATRWSMVEVFLLAALIAVVRSAGLAGVIPGAGIFSFAALTLLLAANESAGLRRLWRLGAALPP